MFYWIKNKQNQIKTGTIQDADFASTANLNDIQEHAKYTNQPVQSLLSQAPIFAYAVLKNGRITPATNRHFNFVVYATKDDIKDMELNPKIKLYETEENTETKKSKKSKKD